MKHKLHISIGVMVLGGLLIIVGLSILLLLRVENQTANELAVVLSGGAKVPWLPVVTHIAIGIFLLAIGEDKRSSELLKISREQDRKRVYA